MAKFFRPHDALMVSLEDVQSVVYYKTLREIRIYYKDGHVNSNGVFVPRTASIGGVSNPKEMMDLIENALNEEIIK